MSRASPRFKRISPSLPPVGTGNGVVMYRIQGQIENQLTVSTFMLSAPVPAPTTAQLNTLLTNLHTALFGKYGACLSADWTAVSEQLLVVHRNDLAGVQSLAAAGTAGARPAGHLPTEVAAVILRVSAVKGQHGRGRLSLPAISTADVTASKVTLAAEITNLNALAAAMIGTVSDGTNNWTFCIGQRATTSPKLVIGFSPIASAAPNLLLGTIRRRKIGRGK